MSDVIVETIISIVIAVLVAAIPAGLALAWYFDNPAWALAMRSRRSFS